MNIEGFSKAQRSAYDVGYVHGSQGREQAPGRLDKDAYLQGWADGKCDNPDAARAESRD